VLHPYVVRDDQLAITNNPISEYRLYLDMGVDGLFSEFPLSAVETFEYFAKKDRQEDQR
jgi:glycerophosphoryl diester phosphodiesterase